LRLVFIDRRGLQPGVSIASLTVLAEEGFAVWAGDEIVDPVFLVQIRIFELLKYRAAGRTAPRGHEQSH
jgi:hypothetical protein